MNSTRSKVQLRIADAKFGLCIKVFRVFSTLLVWTERPTVPMNRTIKKKSDRENFLTARDLGEMFSNHCYEIIFELKE